MLLLKTRWSRIWYNRSRLAGQDEEGRLEGIFGVVVVNENPTADSPHHGPVAANDRLEDGVVTMVHEMIQQLLIRQHPHRTRAEERLELRDRRIPHAIFSKSRVRGVSIRLYILITRLSPFSSTFFFRFLARSFNKLGQLVELLA